MGIMNRILIIQSSNIFPTTPMLMETETVLLEHYKTILSYA